MTLSQQRATILKQLQQVMGSFPPDSRRCDLDVHTLEEVDCGSYVRRLITYQSEPGSTAPAYLLIPKTALNSTRPIVSAMLSLHSTSPDLGHKVVVGLGPRENRDNAHELAQRGHVVIAPAYPLMANYHPDLKKLGYDSGTMKAIWDNSRALDLLDSLPYVRRGRYGVIGHSLGGHNGLFTAAFDQRIKVVVTSCGFDSFQDYMDSDLAGWMQDLYMPRLREYTSARDIPFDFDDVLVAIAPRPVFINAPLHDKNFKWQSVDRMVKSARDRVTAAGGNAVFHVKHPESGHDFPEKVRLEAYEALEKGLTQ